MTDAKTSRDWGSILVMAAAVLAAAGYWYVSSRGRAGIQIQERGPLSAEQEIAAILKANRAIKHPPPAPAPPPVKHPWSFRGKVVELYRFRPLAGAAVRFTAKPFDREGFSASTDASGAFQVDLPALPKGGYYAEVLHQECDPTFLMEGASGDWEKLSWDERVRLIREPQPRTGRPGERGTPVNRDFGLILKKPNLTPEELSKLATVR